CVDRVELQSRLAAVRSFAHAPTSPWAALHRDAYSELLRRAPKTSRGVVTDAELVRLNAARHPLGAVTGRREVSVTQPDPTLASTWWFPYAERLKRYAPES